MKNFKQLLSIQIIISVIVISLVLTFHFLYEQILLTNALGTSFNGNIFGISVNTSMVIDFLLYSIIGLLIIIVFVSLKGLDVRSFE